MNSSPPSRTTNLRNEISNFQQLFDESFHEAWDRYKDLLRACPHHATPPPASIKAVEEICVTCGGAHPYYQFLAAGGNTFPELKDNIQGYVSSVAVNYNQGNSSYRPLEEDERVEETLTDPDLSEYTIKVPPPSYHKMLKALLSNKEKLQELANTPLNENCSAVILKKFPENFGDPGKFLIPCGFSELKDVFVPVGKFTFPADFIIVDYESDPRVPLILGRPFLRTARTLIDVHGKEMILRDGDERLTLNIRHDTLRYSDQPQKESINLINVFNYSSEDFLEDLFLNQPSGNPIFSSHHELTSPEFDIESDLKEIEFLLHQDIDSSLEDSIDQSNIANHADNFVDSMPEMFSDEHALDYLSSSIFDEYDDDFLEVESDAENVYDDPFDSKGEKSNRLMLSPQPTTRTKYLTQEFDPPFYEPLFFKEVPRSKMLLPFSSENEEKVFKPGIHTSENVYSSRIPELSHQGYKVFKINQIFKSPMKIFLFSCGKNTHILVVPCLHFYPLDQSKYGGIGSSSAT
nr:reverse transcriptase domain-containing protein [Tanacetum cinerariifolium]